MLEVNMCNTFKVRLKGEKKIESSLKPIGSSNKRILTSYYPGKQVPLPEKGKTFWDNPV